jgi:predicted nucleic acid-binding protein
MILLDTNLVGRLTDSADPLHATARDAIRRLTSAGERLVIVPQVLYEFWAVATRPAGPPPDGRNGYGMSVSQAGQWIRFCRRRFTLLPDRADLVETWQDLVGRHGITGTKSHDARLAAAMRTYGIASLLTFNAADFRVLPVTAIDPASV